MSPSREKLHPLCQENSPLHGEAVNGMESRIQCSTALGNRSLLCRTLDVARRTTDDEILWTCEKLVAIGVALAGLGFWKEAIRQWQKVLEIDIHNSHAHNNLAVAYEHTGACRSATEQYQAALAFEPTSVHIQQNYRLHQQGDLP
jgi:Flp pilus assembly protein TadD